MTHRNALSMCLPLPHPLKMWDLLTGSTLPQLIYVIVFSCVVWLLLSRRLQSKRGSSLRSVAILVLGDVGRSPRMMYHAESFAKLHFETFLVGYKGTCALWMPLIGTPPRRPAAGSKPVPSLLSLPHVHFLYLSQPPALVQKLPFVVVAPIKIAHQVLSILHALLWCIPHPPEFVLVQVSSLVISVQAWYKEYVEESTQHPYPGFGMAGWHIAGKQSHYRLA
jgi:beta-1,4-mannosyltransferase